MLKSALMVWLSFFLLTGNVLADDDCDDAVSQWQPQEKLRLLLESKGWSVRHIRVDDGCYEVYGRDRQGNHVKAKFSPASLKIHSVKIEFRRDADIDFLNDDIRNLP